MPPWILVSGALATIVVTVLMSQLLGPPDEADKSLRPVHAAGFTISMPGTPQRSDQPVALNVVGPAKDLVGPTTATSYTSESADKVYIVSAVESPTTPAINLSEAVTAMAAATGGSLRESARSRYRGRPAINARITGVADGKATTFARIVHAGDRVFILQVIVEGDDVTTPPSAFAGVLRSLRISATNRQKSAAKRPLLMRKIPDSRSDGAADDSTLTDCIAAAADAAALQRCGFEVIRP